MVNFLKNWDPYPLLIYCCNSKCLDQTSHHCQWNRAKHRMNNENRVKANSFTGRIFLEEGHCWGWLRFAYRRRMISALLLWQLLLVASIEGWSHQLEPLLTYQVHEATIGRVRLQQQDAEAPPPYLQHSWEIRSIKRSYVPLIPALSEE